MGLDVSHDAWHGAYSAFMRWRRKLAEVAELPPLDLMEGFFDPDQLFYDWDSKGWMKSEIVRRLPIRWAALKPDVLYVLLSHSDCDGIIENLYCKPLADRLTELLPLLPDEPDIGHIGIWRDKTQRFIDGLMLAHESGEDLDFH